MFRQYAFPALLFLLALLPGCESMAPGAGGSGQMGVLTSLATQQLGVSESQANGGIGAMLKLAQERLSAGDFDQVAQAIPGTDKYLATAKQLLGGKNVGDTAGLQGAFAKLGLGPEMVDRFKPLLTQAVSAANPTAGTLLAGALQ